MTLTNGVGGFSDDGWAYTIVLEGDEETPLPWTNVIANPRFGTILSASGSATTWSENSRENRLTSFANDPLTDPTAEAIFLRDDDTGASWSPTPGPMRRHGASGRFVVSHSPGQSQFSRLAQGIRSEMQVYVDADKVDAVAHSPDTKVCPAPASSVGGAIPPGISSGCDSFGRGATPPM